MTLARLKWGAATLAFLALAAFLHYSLPSRDVVRIVGTDVVRQDVTTTDPQGNTVTRTRDVRFIYAKTPAGGDRVYRNEDTGWGWPPYFKFDTADLAAQATDLVSTSGNPEWVVVRHYGWRIPILSMYPNAVSIRPATGPDEELFPWFNIVLIALLIVAVLIVRRLIVLFFETHVDPAVEALEQEYDSQVGAIRRTWRRGRRWVRRHLRV